MFKKSNICRICKSDKIKIAFNLGSIPLGENFFFKKKHALNSKKYPLTICWCKNCKNIQVREIIDPKILWKKYTYISGQTNAILKHFSNFAQKVIKRFRLTKNDLIIDIGSNDGSLLKFFKKKKIRVLGVDPAKSIVKIANKNKIKTLEGLFDEKISKKIKKKYSSAKIITAFNVFAHTENLIGMLKAVKNLLEQRGTFIFEVQYLDDIYKKKILGTFFHEHMYHHSVTSLNNFFKNYDMKLFRVERVNIQKGSIIGYVSKDDKIKVESSVKKFLDYEKNIKLFHYSRLKKFKEYILHQRGKILKIIKYYDKKGQIAGYGAARSGPILAINFGIDKYISYIFDDHKLKVNKYSSFNGLKVIPTIDLLKLMPNLCVILAYLHSKKIIRANKEYLKKGGKFLILHPKIMLITKKNMKLYD